MTQLPQDTHPEGEPRPAQVGDGSILELHEQIVAITADVERMLSKAPSSEDGNQLSARRRLISFVIPARDEESTIVELCHRVILSTPQRYDLEFLLIDDGSTDGTWEEIQRFAAEASQEPRVDVRGIRMRHNAGKAAGLAAGFRTSRGDLVFTMDADLQDDPQEIPRFLEAIQAGADVVTGWKQKRFDPWHKVWPSRVFNRMLSTLTGVKLHDHNCGFKCYRAEVVKRVEPHGELHRMMPCLAATHGFKTVEIAVAHSPRRHGQSKYGFERYARGASDMLTMAFLMRFSQRPAHFFNCVAGLFVVSGIASAVTGLCVGLQTLNGLAALVAGGLLCVLASFGVMTGLVSEILVRDGRLKRRELPICDTISSPRKAATPSPNTEAPTVAQPHANLASMSCS